jgi:undecaprenyl-diphosphatase
MVAGAVACAACLIVLVILAYQVSPFENFDDSILGRLNASPGSLPKDLAFLAEQLVTPLSQVVAVTVASLVALSLGRRRRALFAVALVAGTALIVQVLKLLLEHPRYEIAHGPQVGWFPFATSFPSGNSAGALAIMLAFLFAVPCRWRRPTLLIGVGLTLAVGFGLLALNYHYPSDVLGGWLVAGGWCFALLALTTPHVDAPTKSPD